MPACNDPGMSIFLLRDLISGVFCSFACDVIFLFDEDDALSLCLSLSLVVGNRSRPATQSGSSAIKESNDSNSATIDDVNDVERVDRLSKNRNDEEPLARRRDREAEKRGEDPFCLVYSRKKDFAIDVDYRVDIVAFSSD